jgi:TonB family protein
VYRDLSLSLAAHAALLAALLAFSATRQSVRIPETARPVRLITYLESPAAAPASAARPKAAAPASVPTPMRAEPATRPRAAEPPPARTGPAAAKPVAPIAIPKIVIPTGKPVPAPPAGAARRPAPKDTALRDRLARRLTAPPETPTTVESAPKIASLPPAEAPTLPTPVPATSASAAAVPPGSVQSVGFFPHAWYLAVLKERIFSRWVPPSEFFGAGKVTALVSFRIDRSGRVDRLAVRESSGHVRFDRSAMAAVQGLGQVPGLPEQYQEDTLDVVIRFQNE